MVDPAKVGKKARKALAPPCAKCTHCIFYITAEDDTFCQTRGRLV